MKVGENEQGKMRMRWLLSFGEVILGFLLPLLSGSYTLFLLGALGVSLEALESPSS